MLRETWTVSQEELVCESEWRGLMQKQPLTDQRRDSRWSSISAHSVDEPLEKCAWWDSPRCLFSNCWSTWDLYFKVFPSCSNKKLFFGHATGLIVETLILVHWMVCVPQKMNCAPTLVTLALHENPAHQLLRVWHSQTLVSHLISHKSQFSE